MRRFEKLEYVLLNADSTTAPVEGSNIQIPFDFVPK